MHYLYKVFLIRRLPRGPKESLQPIEVRRFSSSCSLNYGALREMFESYFPSLNKTVYSILWTGKLIVYAFMFFFSFVWYQR